MKTWYVSWYNEVYLVTAETVEMARIWLLKYHNISVQNTDLKNVVTHSRWCRRINMLPGETIRSGASPFCPECNKKLEEKVLRSAAGYFIGTSCCDPVYTRESHYYPTKESAELALETKTVNYRT